MDSLGYTGHHPQAIRHYQEALTLYRTLGNSTQAANTLNRLGHSHTALGHQDQARAVWREALELYRQKGRVDDAERVLRQLDDLDNGDK